jgi:hypothetical protein
VQSSGRPSKCRLILRPDGLARDPARQDGGASGPHGIGPDERDQRGGDLAELLDERAKLETVIAPLREELALSEVLAASGAVPRQVVHSGAALAEVAPEGDALEI